MDFEFYNEIYFMISFKSWQIISCTCSYSYRARPTSIELSMLSCYVESYGSYYWGACSIWPIRTITLFVSLSLLGWLSC